MEGGQAFSRVLTSLFSGGGKMVLSASYPLNRNLRVLLFLVLFFLCIVMYVPVNRAWDGGEAMNMWVSELSEWERGV
jgi:hypothetical protein